ncbi:hypothetical protein GPECTOR_10g936 [Gonium pectorale]|uniref:BTB domain-containing protein n=1 Tax=Gonium pectorale TaxID=33097 RepID=A0A150GR81_GONPE|nr:hypothetical protein GPECTOR_10g936 [Gonium pectorale]|eukprot:KXZ52304.1 hypothetical protein GPECTOR_10g936 [Gonium pectorale]
MRFDGCGAVAQVAGRPTEQGHVDGAADAARFGAIAALAADGDGGIIVAEGTRLRRLRVASPPAPSPTLCLQLHAAAAPPPRPPPLALPPPPQQQQQGSVSTAAGDSTDGYDASANDGQGSIAAGSTAAANADPSALKAALTSMVTARTAETAPVSASVVTLLTRADNNPWSGLSFNAATGCLFATTATALYRVKLPPAPSAAAEGTGGSGGTVLGAAVIPLLVSGLQGTTGTADGSWQAARFSSITGVAVDARGEGRPIGHLAVCYYNTSGHVQVIDLQLTPPELPPLKPPGIAAAAVAAAAAAAQPLPGPRTLLLLGADPVAYGGSDPTTDVAVVVKPSGDAPPVRFAAHRSVLAARSEYFRTRLFGGLFTEASPAAAGTADSGSGGGDDGHGGRRVLEVELPDADPAAFAAVLRYCYRTIGGCGCGGGAGGGHGGGAVDPLPFAPLPLLRAVSELADRLLAPELAEEAQRRLLAGCWPEGAVELLLWAEARGPSFVGLLGGLRGFILCYADAVVEAAPGSVAALAAGSPEVMAEMYVAAVKGVRALA